MTEPKEPRVPDLLAEVERLASIKRHPTPEPQPSAWDDEPSMAPLRLAGAWQRSIPSRFLHACPDDLANQPPRTQAALADWCTNPRGRNLVIFGPVGCGKTHTAVAACRSALFERGQEVAFWPLVELLDALRPSGIPEMMAEAMETDLLIMDDLGTEKATEWTAERLYAIVNRRWLEERPVVATTNLPATVRSAPEGYLGETLLGQIGERMFSRLVGSGAVIAVLTGPDRRK